MSHPTDVPALWPELSYDAISPTVDYVHRIAQIAAKYTLDLPFERSWGHIVLTITPRGFTTPLLRSGDVVFTIELSLLDATMTIVTCGSSAHIPIESGTVADFYERFLAAGASLGIAKPGSTLETEIAGAERFEEDTLARTFDRTAARAMWGALAAASDALGTYQAPYFGPRPPVGIMWGGFDLSATRYNGRVVAAPAERPIFQRNGMNSEEVAVGFSFGDEKTRTPAFYAYVVPPPGTMATASFGVPEAKWNSDAGLVTLPWSAVRASDDPRTAVVRFADAVYEIAFESGGWIECASGPRFDGWYASRNLIE